MSTLSPAPAAGGIAVPKTAFIAPNESASGAAAATPLPLSRDALLDDSPILITGGAGFIGCNLADHLLSQGRRVRIFDNVSRPGVEKNLAWLRSRHGERLQLRLGDMRDPHAVEAALRGAGPVYHFAAQAAVAAGLADPDADFDVNARGTLHLLEAIRNSPRRHALVFASTREVYGRLEDLPLAVGDRRYEPDDPALRNGIDESRPYSFHCPHDCSMGAADQCVLDYARIYGVPAVVFRLGCIYGPRQCADEDEGWIAHFLLGALAGRPITLHGDGRQVRDALHINDLIDALLRAQERMDRLAGRAFNIGGGPSHTTSPLELLDLIRDLQGAAPGVEFSDPRDSDPRYYVSDIRAFCAATGWAPRVALADGLARLHRWLVDNPASACLRGCSEGSGKALATYDN